MISLVLKLITLPLLFIIFSWVLPAIDYGNRWTAVLTIAVLILIGIPMEKLLLNKNTFWTILFLDFISSFFIIWLIASLFNQSEVTLPGAILLSIFITIAEYFVHRLILIRKRPDTETY